MDGVTVGAGPASDLAGLGPDVVRPGGLALLVVLGLAIATALLLRSMTVHLRRIDFDESGPAGETHSGGPRAGPDTAPDAASGTASDTARDTARDTAPDTEPDAAPGPRRDDEPETS